MSTFVSFCISLHFFSLFTSLLKNKSNTTNNQRPCTKQPEYFLTPPLLLFFLQNLGLALWKTFSGETLQLSFFFSRSSNTQEPDEQFHPYWPSRMIFETLPLILNQTHQLYTLAVEKAKFDLDQVKLEEETWLAVINSRQSLTTPINSGRNNKEISETLREVFAFAPLFARLPQGEISKIFYNQFWPLSLYKLRDLKSRNNMYRDQIAIEDDTLQIRKVTGSYRDYGNDKALWSEVFLNYMTVMVKLFRSTFDSPLTLTLADYLRKILDFIKVYRWQKKVLPLALNLHTHIVESQFSDFSR